MIEWVGKFQKDWKSCSFSCKFLDFNLMSSIMSKLWKQIRTLDPLRGKPGLPRAIMANNHALSIIARSNKSIIVFQFSRGLPLSGHRK